MTFFQHEIFRKLLIELSRQIDLELSNPFIICNYSPILNVYVRNANFYFKPFLFLAGISSLRFSDLNNFPLRNFANSKTFLIYQNKTHHSLQLDFNFLSNEICNLLSKLPEFSTWLSYQQLKREFHRLHSTYNRNLKFDYKSNTHFFRHANCSFWKSRNWSSRDVAKMLGHVDLTTQKVYFHTELIFN